MGVLSFLAEKPWLPTPPGDEQTLPEAMPAAKIALRFLLVAITVLFALFFVTFITRSQYQDFRALSGEPWQPFTDSWRLWVNTVVLAIASVAMHRAVVALRRGHQRAARNSLVISGVAAVGFLLLQVTVWQFLWRLGYGVSDNPANSYYYLLTGLHGVHLLGGLYVLVAVFIRQGQGRTLTEKAVAIQACATYWHYLLGLWLVLFFMLTRTPESYAFIAALCGLD